MVVDPGDVEAISGAVLLQDEEEEEGGKVGLHAVSLVHGHVSCRCHGRLEGLAWEEPGTGGKVDGERGVRHTCRVSMP